MVTGVSMQQAAWSFLLAAIFSSHHKMSVQPIYTGTVFLPAASFSFKIKQEMLRP